ncbi:hypothetical protein HDV02_001999 [Globomyces sp. JEL0801]|nr:hypothetical protein HDV02_001999 [Globomyces sp. JEL0801]
MKKRLDSEDVYGKQNTRTVRLPPRRDNLNSSTESLDIPELESVQIVKPVDQSRITTYPQLDPSMDIVLPSAPNNQEKLMYLKTNTTFLLSYLIFSFLSITIGMWLFVITDPAFYVFGLFNIYVMIYLILSYATGIAGPDFEYSSHLEIQEMKISVYPSIDIYLPCCREPIEVLQNTWNHVKRLDYPNKIVWVLDDSASPQLKNMALQYKFNYIVRSDRPTLKKSGNLRNAFVRTKGEYYIIFDADFCPRPEMLKEMMVYMISNPNLAVLQTPQFFRIVDGQNWVEQGAGLVQELFYRVIQTKRDRFGAAICVGTSAMYRRQALLEFGGSAPIEHSEDVHTGVQCLLAGWDVNYLPINYSMGMCPNDLESFFNQQYRWANGSITLLLSGTIFKSNLTVSQKICFLCGMLYYISSALEPVINTLPAILLMIVRPEMVKWFNAIFVIPALFVPTFFLMFWSNHLYTTSILKIQLIQSYSHLFAISDATLKRSLEWIPSGASSTLVKSRFFYARVFCGLYTLVSITSLVVLSVWRCFEYPFWHFIPTWFFAILQIYTSIQFIMNTI